jgi:hypothetical protein
MMGKHFNMKSVDREIFSEIFFHFVSQQASMNQI